MIHLFSTCYNEKKKGIKLFRKEIYPSESSHYFLFKLENVLDHHNSDQMLTK